jgi:hypothetical protein
MIGEQNFNLSNIPKATKEESPLRNQENLMALFLRLQNVYSQRPDITEFTGAMSDTKFAYGYLPEQIESDNKYVEETREKIEEHNSSKGQEKLNIFEENFVFAEAAQAMITDRINSWMPDFKTIMTSDYDDLKVGIDMVMKDKEGGYFGTAFDATVSSNADKIKEKIEKNWDNNVSKGSLPVVKYFKDPDTEKMGRITVPKFVIGASANDVNEMAKAYLSGTEDTLDNHPFRKMVLEQIATQIEGVLDFYEDKKDDPKYNFAYRQYVRVEKMIKEAMTELNEAQIIDRLDYHEYSKNSLTMGIINDFIDSKKNI